MSTNTLWFTNKAVLGFNLLALTIDAPDQVTVAAQHALERMDVTDVLPLEQAAETHRRIEQRKTIGKLVLSMSAD